MPGLGWGRLLLVSFFIVFLCFSCIRVLLFIYYRALSLPFSPLTLGRVSFPRFLFVSSFCTLRLSIHIRH